VPRLKSIKKMRGRGSVPLPIHPRVTYAAHLIRRRFRGHNKSSVKARMPDDYEGSTCLSLSSPLYLSLPFVFHVARETRNDRRGHSSSSLLWPRLYLHWWITFFLAEYLCARFCGPALSSALVALLLIFHPLLGSITSWVTGGLHLHTKQSRGSERGREEEDPLCTRQTKPGGQSVLYEYKADRNFGDVFHYNNVARF
jgi:hypothetical protein